VAHDPVAPEVNEEILSNMTLSFGKKAWLASSPLKCAERNGGNPPIRNSRIVQHIFIIK
jgi:hypothetical protein